MTIDKKIINHICNADQAIKHKNGKQSISMSLRELIKIEELINNK